MTDPQSAPAPSPIRAAQPRNRTQGRVVECNGTEARIAAFSQIGEDTGEYWVVGQMISIQTGDNRVVGLLYKVENDLVAQNKGVDGAIILSVELSGEVRPDPQRAAQLDAKLS